MRLCRFHLLLILSLLSCESSLTVVEVLDGSTVLLSNGTSVSLMKVAKTESNRRRLLEILDKEIYLFDESMNPISPDGGASVTAILYDRQGGNINDQLSRVDGGLNDGATHIDGNEMGPSLTELFDRTKSAIFFVFTEGDSAIRQGSGFFINSSGTGVSNYHVFEGTRRGGEIIKTEDGSMYRIAKVLAQDVDLDYIIFSIENLPGKVHPFVNISSRPPAIGESVFSIGNPLGLEKTLSSGVISGFRSGLNLIQTTSEITNGSSGGALFNMNGEVIGITTSGVGEANINFAINIDKTPARELAGHGRQGDAKPLLSVIKIVDGDTFYVANSSGEAEKVRLIGVNAPESKSAFNKKKEYFGRESKEYLSRILYGNKVRLELDVRKIDQYGRTLAYVYLEDGTFLNDKMVKEGFAQVMTVPPNIKYQGMFIESERFARSRALGLWK